MSTILYYLQDMGTYMLMVLPVIIVIRLVRAKRLNTKTTILREIGIVVFFMFLTGLLSQTILPSLSTHDGEVQFINGDHQAINMEPFRVVTETYNAIKYLDLWQPFLINFVGNIVMFMPIGFFLPLLWGKFNRAWRAIGIGLLLSLFIEVVQLTQLRSSDVDDLWLNTLGAIFGYIVYKSCPKMFKRGFIAKEDG